MKTYLPLGSVVLLKEGKKRLMIYGRLQRNKETEKVFDYIGCLYPEGLLDSSKAILFDQEDIQRLYFIGFQDAEEFAFRQRITDYLKAEGKDDKDEGESQDK